ncbi:MAG TPA: GNAT family N-acetyltransferase [Pyrinomonadaceae bacterium]|jgi:ribosomal protein S18 acetylase RimI-like enzyme|nr:GNAT family N-acetyltransferase [Pyrinomonadaceae bacterium]
MVEAKTANIRIRVAVPEDAPSIAAILYESFIEYKSSYTEEAFAATAPASDQIQARMREGPVWVALQDDTIVGTVAAVPKGAALYIRGMGVLPTARGQRVGEILLREIERFASERGLRRLYLSTTPFLNRAIRLYEHYGFRHSSEGPHELLGTPLVTMEKFLGSSARERDA